MPDAVKGPLTRSGGIDHGKTPAELVDPYTRPILRIISIMVSKTTPPLPAITQVSETPAELLLNP